MLDKTFFTDETTEQTSTLDGYLKTGWKTDKMFASKTWLVMIASDNLKTYFKDKGTKLIDVNEYKYVDLGVNTIHFSVNAASIYQGAETRDLSRTLISKCDGSVITWPDEKKGMPCKCAHKTASQRYEDTKQGMCIPYVDMTGEIKGYEDFTIRYTNNKWYFNKQLNRVLLNINKERLEFVLMLIPRTNKEGFPYSSAEFKLEG